MSGQNATAEAMNLPNGARFYRCALQINPFPYLQANKTPTTFGSEAAYNEAMVAACVQHGIEVIAVTDHYRLNTSLSLMAAARKAGISVFPGFAAKTHDGVHFLCLLDPSTSPEVVQSKISACGVHGEPTEASPLGNLFAEQFLKHCLEWDARCIAAHVAAQDGGLLRMVKGQARSALWKHPGLLACSLPGSLAEAPEDLRNILSNKDPAYHRDRPVAILNHQDASAPADLAKPGASCWIKMSSVSAQGLRQAFLDPASRIRLASDPPPEEHAELVAIAWETEGFLKQCAIHFNENLNVLVGGRGTGKSTVIESLRYVLQLEPVGDDARRAHEGIIRQVLRSGTKVSLRVRLQKPTKREYVIERTVPNPPVVRDERGDVLAISPRDLLPRVELFGQHEISEMAKSPAKLTALLDRFVTKDSTVDRRKNDLRSELRKNRLRVGELRAELQRTEERLAALPSIRGDAPSVPGSGP